MANNGKTPEATIQRLPVYLYRLLALQEQGVERVSSRELAEELKITPSRLRQDFHCFGGFSQQGKPYAVNHLVARLREILGLEGETPFIIVGTGHLGQAIANYNQFSTDGFRMVGLFDSNPRLEGLAINGVQVRNMDELPRQVEKLNVKLGIVAVPPRVAQDVTDKMIAAGITGIWNFAPVNLRVPPDVFLQDEFLSVGIMTLRFKMKGSTDRPCS